MIRTEPAAIFRCSDGRRYFTKRAAVKHEAWIAFKAENQPEDEDSYGMAYSVEQLKSFVEYHARVKAAHRSAQDGQREAENG